MATKHELEQKPLFRLTKVIFWVFALIAVGLTVVVWYVIASSSVDASSAYFVCNSSTVQHPLTSSEQSDIESSKATRFAYGSTDQTNTNKLCYQEYSGGKDPNSASQSDINFFHQMQAGSNGQVYTIFGVQHNWYWGWLIGVLVVEYFIFQILKTLGLYVAGGEEALK